MQTTVIRAATWPSSSSQVPGGHADPRTTKLYDRRRQQVTRGEVERIRYELKAQTPGGVQERRL